jgi:tetratricopeptide (TPR) repeat protein
LTDNTCFSYELALEDANKSLELDPTFKKSLSRRATANVELGKAKEAMDDLRQIFQLESKNLAVKALMKRCSPTAKMNDDLRVWHAKHVWRRSLMKEYNRTKMRFVGGEEVSLDEICTLILRHLVR